MKINVIKVMTVVGTLLSLGGSLLSGVASDKKTEETVARLVKDKLEGK